MIEIMEFGKGVGFMKAGIYGDAGTGKDTTAVIIANGLWHHFKLAKPIAFIDTETGAEYVNSLSRDGRQEFGVVGTGLNIVGTKTRNFQKLVEFLDWCESNASIAIVDSITHFWESLQRDMLDSINKVRVGKGQNPLSKLEIHHREAVNTRWAQFTTRFLNSNLHVILCGRSANVWETEINEETGKREFNVVGTRMKVGADTSYEPSVVFQMERVYVGKNDQRRICTVIKDRFGCMDGAQAENPKFDFFMPYVNLLTPAAENKVDVTSKTPIVVNEEGDAEWAQERRARSIAVENLVQALRAVWPGESAGEKWCRWEVVWKLLATRSQTEVESMRSDKVNAAIAAMKPVVEEVKAELAKKEKEEAEAEAKAKADAKAAKSATKAETVSK
jgi:AAA domain-containing protein